MKDQLHIYIDRLKGGHTEKIKTALPPSFLEIAEAELSFPEEVHISGETYLADEHLIVHLSLRATAALPCSICNHPVPIPIDIRDHYISEPLETIRGAVYDFAQEVREAILLQVPQFAECNGGSCPERETLKPFLNASGAAQKDAPSQTVHFPFADLDKE